MKNIYFPTVVLIALIFSTIGTKAQPANLCCPYIGWDYIVPITISNSTGAAIPAQSTLFIINTATPISAGKMQSNGNDIRFIYNTCGNYLNYWIESGINTASTNIWIALPAIPNGGSLTLYMYYGNAAAAGASVQSVLFPVIQTITGVQTLSGTITADWINVNAATITAPTSAPLVLIARKIVFNGTYNANNSGYGPQAGPGAGINGGGSVGGSGGSYGGRGGSGAGGQSNTYGTANGPDIDMGSGGGGSDCNATAAGGGAISIIASVISLAGTINVNGQGSPFCCCGNSSEAAGAGAGGGVLIEGDYVSGNATINAVGGYGGGSDTKESGGGGGGGRVKVRWCKANTFNGTVDVSGGAFDPNNGQGGTTNGQNGTYTQPQITCDAIVISPEQPVSIPTASLTYNNACTGVVTTFNSTTTLVSGGSISTYAWDFGDGGTAASQSPTHGYANTGNFNVSLTVTSITGCTDAVIVPITVQQLPVADFTASTACAGNATAFTDASTGGAVKWIWDFGDGNSDTVQNPSHIYSGGGNFTGTLIAINSGNCSDTIQKPVVFYASPLANFSATNVCFANAVQFNNTSIGAITNNAWSFGDAQISTQPSPLHTYASPATYNVMLIVATANNCADTALQTVIVNLKPTSDFSVTPVCQGLTSSFTDASSVSSGSIIAYGWSFGDGNFSTQQSPSNLYTSANTYNVTLIVQTDSNCYDTISKQAIVNPLPNVDFTAGAVCLNQSYVFVNSTSIASGSLASAIWNFGDGNSSTSQSPANTYTTSGTFPVSLVEVSDKGCSDSVTKSITVFDLPVATTSSTPACYVQPTGTATVSINGGTTANTTVWSNGQSSSTATNLLAGIYDVTVSDANNCTAMASAIVTEPASALIAIAAPAAPNILIGDMVSITLSNNYNDANAVYSTNPSYGLSCTDCAQMDALPYQTTEYFVSVTDNLGCTGSGKFIINVDQSIPIFIPNAFTPNGDGSNDSWGIFSRAVKQLSLSVFNRWGEKVFETDNMNDLWDGTYQDKPAQEGVYVYKGYAVYLNDKTRQIKGSVTIIR